MQERRVPCAGGVPRLRPNGRNMRYPVCISPLPRPSTERATRSPYSSGRRQTGEFALQVGGRRPCRHQRHRQHGLAHFAQTENGRSGKVGQHPAQGIKPSAPCHPFNSSIAWKNCRVVAGFEKAPVIRDRSPADLRPRASIPPDPDLTARAPTPRTSTRPGCRPGCSPSGDRCRTSTRCGPSRECSSRRHCRR